MRDEYVGWRGVFRAQISKTTGLASFVRAVKLEFVVVVCLNGPRLDSFVQGSGCTHTCEGGEMPCCGWR
jgi:hypothetical protein